MHFRSLNDLNQIISNSLSKIDSTVDLIVGVPRSGMIPAILLGLYLNKAVTDLEGFLAGKIMSPGMSRRGYQKISELAQVRTALIIDDSIYSGKQLCEVRRQVEAAHLDCKVIFAVVYATKEAVSMVDLLFEVCPSPRVFEWNLMHHSCLAKSCMDIDGVLCRDPTEQENDDGPHYEEFLRTTEPMVIPTAPVGWLVTCRLEKYRLLTEQWLKEKGVEYRDLIMMPYNNMAERRASGDHGIFKGKVYAQTGALLFIESSLQQSFKIADVAARPVFCTETRQMIMPDSRALLLGAAGKLIRDGSARARFARGLCGRVLSRFMRT